MKRHGARQLTNCRASDLFPSVNYIPRLCHGKPMRQIYLKQNHRCRLESCSVCPLQAPTKACCLCGVFSVCLNGMQPVQGQNMRILRCHGVVLVAAALAVCRNKTMVHVRCFDPNCGSFDQSLLEPSRRRSTGTNPTARGKNRTRCLFQLAKRQGLIPSSDNRESGSIQPFPAFQ
jgi:hypothetical protein